ncbi:MAG: DUF3102 domain-containing protein [Oscillospiraceae bacterium]|nr:DUF3102 domain-containing protein [Oscillospiraceae bacterium]
MNELSTTRTPEVIASEVMTLTASALVNIIEIGRRFTEAKEILPVISALGLKSLAIKRVRQTTL